MTVTRVSFGISVHSRTCLLLAGIIGPPGWIWPPGDAVFGGWANTGLASAELGGDPVAGPPETVTAFPQAASPGTRPAAITPSAVRPAAPLVLPSLTIAASSLSLPNAPD